MCWKINGYRLRSKKIMTKCGFKNKRRSEQLEKAFLQLLPLKEQLTKSQKAKDDCIFTWKKGARKEDFLRILTSLYLSSPEPSKVFIVAESFMSFSHYYSLTSVLHCLKVSGYCSIFAPSLASSNMPCISNH